MNLWILPFGWNEGKQIEGRGEKEKDKSEWMRSDELSFRHFNFVFHQTGGKITSKKKNNNDNNNYYILN